MRERRELLLVPVLLIAGCVALAGWAFHTSGERARAQSTREDGALALLHTLESAQRAHQARTGDFGWLDELSLDLPTQTDEAGSFISQDGYRFDAMLPAIRQDTPAIQLVTQSAKGAHRELRTQYFVLVARPLDPGISGYRTYYVDESKLVWISEGVSDEKSSHRNALPVAHLGTTDGKDVSGQAWTRLDTLVPRGTAEWERR